MALDTFEWENGTLVEPAKVEVGGVSYDVTDAQYSGDTPLTAGNLNQMQTILNGNIENYTMDFNSYSTTEKVIGKWIDNKSIYRKAISTTYSSVISTNVTNVDTMVRMEVLVCDSGNTGWRNIPWLWVSGNSYGGASFAGGYFYKVSDGKINFQIGSDLASISKVIIILEYTKTSS